MADNIMFNVKPDFDLALFANRLADTYRAKGYTVNVANLNGTCILTFDKDSGGLNNLLGLGEGIKATCMLNNDALCINFTDADWTGKIVACVVGWFLCLVPFINTTCAEANLSRWKTIFFRNI